MMPYDTYRLYQAERSKSPREIHHADQRAAQLASAVSGLFRAITQTAHRPHPSAADAASPQTAPAACRDTMAGARWPGRWRAREVTADPPGVPSVARPGAL
jgi:hypothetical protein